MSVTGGLGRIATTTYKRLASMLSSKWNQPYSTTMDGFAAAYRFLFFVPPFSLSEVLVLRLDDLQNLLLYLLTL